MRVSFSPPNQLTLLRVLLTPVFVVFLFSSDSTLRQLSLVVFVLAGLTDWYDGWVARRWGYVSRWGAFLDPLADKVVTSAALVAFIYLNLTPAWPIWLIVFRDILITVLRSYSEYKGKPFVTKKLAKTKTFLQFMFIYYLLLVYLASVTDTIRTKYAGLIESLLNPSLLYTLTVVVAALTIYTGLLYLVENWKTIRELYALPGRVTQSQ